MTPRRSDELGQALRQQGDEPLDVVDPATNVHFVLIRSDQFAKVRALFSDELFEINEAYPLQDEVAAAEIRDDPQLDDYDARRPAT